MRIFAAGLATGFVLWVASSYGQLPSPSPSVTALPSGTPLPSTTPLPSVTPSPTETPTPIPTESPSPSPTETPSPTPIESPTPSPVETPPPVNPVIGQWTDGETGLAVEFKHNGTVAETRPDGTIGEGTYAFTDDTHIQVQPASDLIPSGAYVATLVITGNQMQFFTLSGDILKSFTRSVLPSPTPGESPPPSATPSPSETPPDSTPSPTETPLPTATPSPTI